CVENDEELTIRADGSVGVRLHAKGRPADFGEGYAMPLQGPWSAQNASTIAEGADVDLEVAAEFSSVRDLPRFYAPAGEPYRTAYLQRTSDLRVESKGGRKVYTFERTFHRREFKRFDALSTMELDADFQHKLEKNE